MVNRTAVSRIARRACSLRGLPRAPVTDPTLQDTMPRNSLANIRDIMPRNISPQERVPMSSYARQTSNDARHTVIIGGTAGIGLATARQLLTEGHRLTLIGRDPDRLKLALADLTN